MKLYIANTYFKFRIQKIQISKETDKFYWDSRGVKKLKNKRNEKAFHTEEEARKHIIEVLNKRIQSGYTQIEKCKENIEEYKKELKKWE